MSHRGVWVMVPHNLLSLGVLSRFFSLPDLTVLVPSSIHTTLSVRCTDNFPLSQLPSICSLELSFHSPSLTLNPELFQLLLSDSEDKWSFVTFSLRLASTLRLLNSPYSTLDTYLCCLVFPLHLCLDCPAFSIIQEYLYHIAIQHSFLCFEWYSPVSLNFV